MAIMVMILKDNRDMRSQLLKFGVALALSFAGFLYSQLRTRRIRPTTSSPRLPQLPPPRPSVYSNNFDTDGRADLKDDLCSTQVKPPGSSNDASFTTHLFVEASSSSSSSHQKFTNDGHVVGLSLISKNSGEEEGLLLPEFNELVLKNFELTSYNASIRKEVDTVMARKIAAEKEETEQENINLRNMVKVLQEREKNLENKLLEYYGLKEQETAVMELQNRLKLNNMEAKVYTLKIESLQAENQRLEARVADHARVVSELETAKAKIKMLKKLRSDEEQNRELQSALQRRVANLQEQEQMAILNDADVQSKLQRLKELVDESAELKKANSSLQRENSELAERLKSTQILASSILEDPETEALREANNRLRRENEELMKELASVRSDCCADVEELVYLRWVNACLRYELRNYQPPPGKTVARDLSKTLSPKSEEKIKQLILEYANSEGFGNKGDSIVDFDSDQWSLSQASYLTDSGEYDDAFSDVSSATRTHTSSKTKFFSRLKNLVRGKVNYKSVDRKNTSFSGSGRNESASTTSVEDMEGNSCDTLSSHHNSSVMATPLMGIGVRIDGQSTQMTLSQGGSSRRSLDIQRLRNVHLEEIRDEESKRRNSDVGSSFGYKKMVLGKNDGLSPDNHLDQNNPDARDKLELINFAEVLRSSRETSKSRKSTAYSS
ncbi:protein CHUP1, chloroplastic-like [Telopea speciosissima]|uniref:protein CHUP1, chloroplastic-like n=1 Tax=Telopea speciosissima TaxID=54955 RepID=UPI001CC51C01|nr:protein CHUP1, chloroplastic-like [Telopea speciosissima]